MGSFDGVAEVYDESRRGYPPQLRDHLFAIGALSPDSRVLDLGAGTGQLATLVAQVADSVIAMDPEPDMFRVGRQATSAHSAIQWIQGSDRDLGRVITEAIDLVLIGNAFQHMDQESLLENLDLLVSEQGSVVICSSSTPVWLQDADWSRALKNALISDLGLPISGAGVPNHESDLQVLANSAFAAVAEWLFERDELRSPGSIVGEVMSSTSGALDEDAAELLAGILEPFANEGAVNETVRTTALVARRPT